MKNRYRKKRNIMLLLILVLFVSVGYALLSTTLNINGTTKVKNATWNIYWDNANVTDGSVTEAKPTIDSAKTTASFNVELEKPGDFYEFTIDAKNDGTIDGMISNISYKLNDTEIGLENPLPAYLNYTVTYSDDVEVEANHLLAANTKETYKVRVEFKKNIENNQLPGAEVTLSLKFAVTYIQADNSIAKERAITLCRRATKLKTEVCNLDENANNDYCPAVHDKGDIISYGNLNSDKNSLNVGDAFDCDVDNNGLYDADERFYYLYNLDSDTSVLIYYNNVQKGEPDEVYSTAYDIDNNVYANGPKTAILDLPTSAQWPNVELKSKVVDIYDDAGNIRKSNFSYEGYAARLLTMKELDIACGTSFEGSLSGWGQRGDLDNCEFLLENTYYSKPYTINEEKITNPGYWINTSFQYTTTLAFFVSTSGRMLGSPGASGTQYGVRPVIEVPTIELKK